MNNQDLARLSFFEPLPTHLRALVYNVVISELWTTRPSVPKYTTYDDTSAYIEFFERECRNARKRDHAAKTYQDIIDIVQHSQRVTNRNWSRAQLRTSICSSCPELRPSFNPTLQASEDAMEILDNSINLALRLFLMLKLQGSGSGSTKSNFRNAYAIAGEIIIHWEESQTLYETINDEFQESQARVHRDREFSALLTARNLELYGGFRITWTSNLAEHLCITRYDNFTEVSIFHYATVLNWHKTHNALPLGLAQETLRTLALLLPSRDFAISHYTGIDKQAFSHGETQQRDLRKVSTYTYFRDRLLSLEKAFGESEPATLWQWWYDRRKRREWATFWVAVLVLVLTIFFGMIQSITGLVSAWAAIKQLEQAKSGG